MPGQVDFYVYGGVYFSRRSMSTGISLIINLKTFRMEHFKCLKHT